MSNFFGKSHIVNRRKPGGYDAGDYDDEYDDDEYDDDDDE